MIWILLSVLYAALGFLYSEAAWNAPEIKKELEELRSIAPPEMINGRLAIAKLVIAVFWPIFFFGSLFALLLQVLGIIKKEEEDEGH